MSHLPLFSSVTDAANYQTVERKAPSPVSVAAFSRTQEAAAEAIKKAQTTKPEKPQQPTEMGFFERLKHERALAQIFTEERYPGVSKILEMEPRSARDELLKELANRPTREGVFLVYDLAIRQFDLIPLAHKMGMKLEDKNSGFGTSVLFALLQGREEADRLPIAKYMIEQGLKFKNDGEFYALNLRSFYENVKDILFQARGTHHYAGEAIGKFLERCSDKKDVVKPDAAHLEAEIKQRLEGQKPDDAAIDAVIAALTNLKKQNNAPAPATTAAAASK
jgi:hypothetical protein